MSSPSSSLHQQPHGNHSSTGPSQQRGYTPRRENNTMFTFSAAIHYLQREHRKYETGKSLWDLERAELQSKISTLEQYCKMNEKLQYDLLRRVKMLEVALRNERARYQMLTSHVRSHDQVEEIRTYLSETLESMDLFKEGTDEQKKDDLARQVTENNANAPLPDVISRSVEGKSPQSSQMLRKFLEEINASDAWLFVQKSHVDLKEPNKISAQSIDENELGMVSSDTFYDTQHDDNENMVETVMYGNGNPLPRNLDADPENMDETKLAENLERTFGMRKEDLDRLVSRSLKKKKKTDAADDSSKSDMLKRSSFGVAENAKFLKDLQNIKLDDKKKSKSSSEPLNPLSQQLTQHQWKPKYMIASHLDAVRSVSFHRNEPVLLSASEDATVKLWNLKKLSKKHSTITQPVHTYRGHNGPVFASLMGRDCCFSAGADGDVRVWDLPVIDQSPYINHGIATPYERFVLKGHTDSVWSLAAMDDNDRLLLSAGSDGAVLLWDLESEDKESRQRHKFALVADDGVSVVTPTHVTTVPNDSSKVVVSYANSTIALFDAHTGKIIWKTVTAPSANDGSSHLIYQSIVHPTMPLLLSANEDKYIRYLDMNDGKCTAETVAHQDAVTSLSIDPSGLYFMSGGHDSSVRVWDISTRNCIQDLMSHRKKYDEAVHCVQYHPSLSFAASSGADSRVVILQ